MGQWAVWVWLLDSQAHVRSQPIKGSQNTECRQCALGPSLGQEGFAAVVGEQAQDTPARHFDSFLSVCIFSSG